MLIKQTIGLGQDIAEWFYNFLKKKDSKKTIKEDEQCSEQMHRLRLAIGGYCDVCDSKEEFKKPCPKCGNKNVSVGIVGFNRCTKCDTNYSNR